MTLPRPYGRSLGQCLSKPTQAVMLIAVLGLHVLVPWWLSVMHANDSFDEIVVASPVLEVRLSPLMAADPQPTALQHDAVAHPSTTLSAKTESVKPRKNTQPHTTTPDRLVVRETQSLTPLPVTESASTSRSDLLPSASSVITTSQSSEREQSESSATVLPQATQTQPSASLNAPLRYASAAPRPVYPRLSQRLGEEGTVTLRIRVNAMGEVERLEVRQSSGFPLLDEAALTEFRRTRYIPARMNGIAVAQTVDVRVSFRLDEAPSVY